MPENEVPFFSPDREHVKISLYKRCKLKFGLGINQVDIFSVDDQRKLDRRNWIRAWLGDMK